MYRFSQYPNYSICESLDDVVKMFTDLRNETIVALDTETSGLSPYSNFIIGYAFGKGPNIGYYIPIRHIENPIREYEVPGVQKLVKDYLEKTPEVSKAFWNAKFDIKMFKREGIRLSGPIHDGMILLSIAHKPLEFEKTKLKSAAKEVLGLDPVAEKFLSMEKRGKADLIEKYGYACLSYVSVGFYAAEDAVFTYKLYEHLIKGLDAE